MYDPIRLLQTTTAVIFLPLLTMIFSHTTKLCAFACNGIKLWTDSKLQFLALMENSHQVPELHVHNTNGNIVAWRDVGKAKCPHSFEVDRTGESTNKRAYQTVEVWKKVIRREPTVVCLEYVVCCWGSR